MMFILTNETKYNINFLKNQNRYCITLDRDNKSTFYENLVQCTNISAMRGLTNNLLTPIA